MERERYVIDSRLRPGRGSLPPEGPGSSALGRPQDPSSLPAGPRGAADRPRRGMRRRRAPADVHRLGGSGGDPSKLEVCVEVPPDLSPAEALARLERAKGLL